MLKHCEFQSGGQCCLVCPKGLEKVNEQMRTSDRILDWTRRMKKILPRLHGRKLKDDGEGLPRGVGIQNGKYIAYIAYNKKHYYLIGTLDVNEAIRVRADAEKAKKNGDFTEWLRHFRESAKEAKNGKRT